MEKSARPIRIDAYNRSAAAQTIVVTLDVELTRDFGWRSPRVRPQHVALRICARLSGKREYARNGTPGSDAEKRARLVGGTGGDGGPV
jgi:hypothetical protein